MKPRLFLFILLSVVCINGFSQEDPLKKQKRSPENKGQDEQKLNEKGKAEFDKAKTDFKNINNPKFELAANEIVNEDLQLLVGVPSNEKPDTKLSEKQNEDNKKNQKEIQDKLRKGAKNDKIEINFSPSGNPPVGASSSDATFWYPEYYTPVKNQGKCGSCWAFAACAAFEHTTAKLWATKFDLSEQDIVACGATCNSTDCGGCNGGWSDKAFDYIKCHGVASETSYPYTAKSNPCISKASFKSASTWGQLLVNGSFPSIEWVKYYLTIYGSLVTYMKAGISTFYSYGYGVYNGYPSTSTNSVDHAVTLVGWSDDLQAWIIKNSWGAGWGGYGGYAYIGYNQCNLAKYVYWILPNQ